jgi:hypothetical protein
MYCCKRQLILIILNEHITCMVLQPSCWVPCTPLFFLVLPGLVKRSLWGPLLRALRFPVRLHRFVWISPGLWFCGRSEIESKSSRFRCLSPRRLVASNLGRYKASYPPLFAASYLVISNLLSWRSGHPEEVSIGILLLVISDPYHVVIRAIVVTVGFVITYLSIYSFTIYYCFYPSHIFVSPYPTVH